MTSRPSCKTGKLGDVKSVPGTNDVFAQAREFAFREPVVRFITQTAERVLRSSGAQALHTPIFEEAEVFVRGVGASSDIVVKKEMYTFLDRGDRLLALRPEPTAAMVRAYNQHGMKVWPQPVRLFTIGPIFRAERQQKGRYKQFHQIDFEALGLAQPVLDAECIALMVRILQALGLEQFEVKLGSVGDPADRLRYNQYLRDQLSPHQPRLSEVSRQRLVDNPLRIFDSKEAQDQQLLEELKLRPLLDFLGDEARAFHLEVARLLGLLGIPFVIDTSIVRGLDYYVRTAWEIHHGQIGAKSALAGGGRYDGLSQMLGGPPVPGVGFGMGIERLALALEEERVEIPADPAPQLFLAPLDQEGVAEALALSHQLGRQRVEMGYTPRSARKLLEDALRRQAQWVVFLGQGERERGLLTLKNLETGQQHEVAAADLPQWLG